MAAASNQDTVEEDASDLCFPKDGKRKGEIPTKTFKIIEKFPSSDLGRVDLKNGINYLVSISGSYWFMYNPSRRSVYMGPVSDVFGSSEAKPWDKVDVNSIPVPSIVEWEIKKGIPFDPSNLLVHPEHPGLCILWGKKGVAVVRIPVGKKKERLDFVLVGEDLYVEDVKLETLQVRWHPSPMQKLITVLFNDQVIRIYDGLTGELFTGSVSIAAARSTTLSFRELDDGELDGSLDDRAVDIDYGPHLPKSNLQMLFVLLESGNVYYVLVRSMDSVKRCYTELHGPVKFNEDMEQPVSFTGYRCSSLVSTKKFPIVIATGDLTNTLKHYVILPDDVESEEYNLEENILANDLTLYLREKIILETMCESDPSSVTLFGDPRVDSRYVCVTDTGLYLVNMNFVPELRAFLKDDDDESFGLKSVPSSAQFLICWKVSDSAKTGKCLAGLSFGDSLDDKLLIVLGNMSALAIDISGYFSTSASELGQVSASSRDSPLRTSTAFPADVQDIMKTVTNILKRSSTQPFMCSNQDLDGDELVKFSCDGVDVLTKEYIERQEEAANYLSCSIDTLKVKKETLAENIQELKAAKVELRSRAENIAEQYEECLGKMEDFKKRLDVVLQRQRHTLPDMTDEEKKWVAKMENIKTDVDVFNKWLSNLKDNLKTEQKGGFEDPKKSSFLMGQNHIREFKKELVQHTDTIAELTKQVTELKQLQGLH